MSEVINLNEWFDRILTVHYPPCYVLVKIDEEHKIGLIGVSSNLNGLDIVMEASNKDKQYIG